MLNFLSFIICLLSSNIFRTFSVENTTNTIVPCHKYCYAITDNMQIHYKYFILFNFEKKKNYSILKSNNTRYIKALYKIKKTC